MQDFLNRLIQSAWSRLRDNQMLRHSAIIFTGYLIAHLLNTVYQMVVSRVLSPMEYTLLAAFVSALLIVQYPLMTLTTALSRFSSLLVADKQYGDVRRLLTRWLLRTGLAGTLLAIAGILLRDIAGEILHIHRTGPIIVAALSLPLFLMLPIVLGVSQGMQHFGWNTLTTIGGSLTRVVLGSFLILCMAPSSGWALAGHGAGIGFTVLTLALGLYWILRASKPTTSALPQLRLFLVQSGLVQLAYATLMTADILLIKHLLPQEVEFAYAATLGRLAVFLSSTIVIAMFPKVTSSGRISSEQLLIFKQSLLYTAVCTLLAMIGCAVFPRLLLRILFGMQNPSRNLQLLMIAMTFAMSLSALLNTCLQFLVAQKRFLPTIWVCVAAVAYITACDLYHESAWAILLWATLANGFALLMVLPVCWRTKPARLA
jgi:O-antigen/teichoic acid export membrane protein